MYLIGILIVASVSFGFGLVSNENTLNHLFEKFQVIFIGDENKHMTAYFMHE